MYIFHNKEKTGNQLKYRGNRRHNIVLEIFFNQLFDFYYKWEFRGYGIKTWFLDFQLSWVGLILK